MVSTHQTQLATEIVSPKTFQQLCQFCISLQFLVRIFFLFYFGICSSAVSLFFHPLARKIVEKCFAMQIFVNQAETELRATSWSSCWPTHKKRVTQGRALKGITIRIPIKIKEFQQINI